MSKERLEMWKTQLKQAERPSKSGPRTKRIEGCKCKIAKYQKIVDAQNASKIPESKAPRIKRKEGES